MHPKCRRSNEEEPLGGGLVLPDGQNDQKIKTGTMCFVERYELICWPTS